jgi:hypothetical protein
MFTGNPLFWIYKEINITLQFGLGVHRDLLETGLNVLTDPQRRPSDVNALNSPLSPDDFEIRGTGKKS